MASTVSSHTILPTNRNLDGAVTGAIKVSLATPDDIPALIPIFWDAFSGPAETTFPHTDGGRAWLERSFHNFVGGQSFYRPKSHIPVVRNANGRPVSFAIVHVVNPGQSVVGSSWRQRWSRADDLPDVSEERLASFYEPLARWHHLTIGKQGHVFIEFLSTKLTSRHKGYATAIVNWVTNLADEVGYACYLDGGGRGTGILNRAGFMVHEMKNQYPDPPPCSPMVRAKKGA